MTGYSKGDLVIYNSESIVTFVQDLADNARSIVELGGATTVVPSALLSRLTT